MANQELLLFGKWSYEDLECSDATLTVSGAGGDAVDNTRVCVVCSSNECRGWRRLQQHAYLLLYETVICAIACITRVYSVRILLSTLRETQTKQSLQPAHFGGQSCTPTTPLQHTGLHCHQGQGTGLCASHSWALAKAPF